MRGYASWRRLLAVLGGALMLAWPALYNRYPLLYPDSISYLGDGRPIARSLFGHRVAGFVGMRSEMYSLSIFPWHWNVTPWPIVALNALVTAAVLWWVVRSLVERRVVVTFLGMVAFLSLLTSLSWYVSFIMPDVLGGLLYLCIYLLVFARESLRRWERILVGVITVWAAAAHATHLFLAVALCLLLLLLWVMRWSEMRGRRRGVGAVALVLLMAAGAQMALHSYLYGRATLNGNRLPYMMARVIADGPGRMYLEKNCGHLQWAICDHVQNLPDNDDAFLWAEGGIWPSASPATQARLLEEEEPLVLGTLRTFPRMQIGISLRNFWEQLDNFGIEDFYNNTWMEGELDHVMPGSLARYGRGRQAQDAVTLQPVFSRWQRWTVFFSAAVVPGFLWSAWRRRDMRMSGIGVVIVFTVIANAFVTAVFSTTDSRYQSRVIWMVPLLAALCVARCAGDRAAARKS